MKESRNDDTTTSEHTLPMLEHDFQAIPAIARRIARDQLIDQLTRLEMDLADALSAGKAQAQSARDERSALEAVISQHVSTNNALQVRLSGLEVDAVRQEEVLAELESRLSSVLSEYANFRAEHENLHRTMREEFESALAHKAETNEALQAQIVELTTANANLDKALTAAQAEIVSVSSEYSAFQAAQVALQQSTLQEFEAQLEQQVALNAALKRELDHADADASEHQYALKEQEIAECRRISEKCLFVIGFARSNTTLTLEMLNCAENALLLGEADFFLQEHGSRFNDWYNNQHKEFTNQVTKSSYAPDLLPGTPHAWWQWLASASDFYDCVGEKIALSQYHLGKAHPDAFRAFHEARFLSSRYIFMLRNPVDVLLSSAKLFNITTDIGMLELCIAWLDYLQLWSDSIRVFPKTFTIVVERFGADTVTDLEAFTGLNLGDARLLYTPENQRIHKLTRRFPSLLRFRGELESIYADAIAAVDESKALWQAEQKRTPSANQTKGEAQGMIAMTPRPLGRAWLKIQALRDTLVELRKDNSSGK